MININIPNNNFEERKYILDVFFDQFLDIQYSVETKDIKHYEINLGRNRKIIIEDNFFNLFPNDLEYLSVNNIPQKINFFKNQFIIEKNIPVIFGNSRLEISNDKIICGIDIFASSFFMLTRWEEYVIKKRDIHNRFSAYESLAFKYNFLNRPVVNEYTVMLKNMLKHIDNRLRFKKYKYSLLLTHDVDIPLKYRSFLDGFREILGDLVKRKKIRNAVTKLYQKINVHLAIIKDPYDTFDYLMNFSERHNLNSYFFFMGKGQTVFDNMYKSDDSFITKLVENINSRGHHVGLHPSYNSYKCSDQFFVEKSELESNFNQKINIGRQHYLRFEIPYTWQVWEDNNMEWDSTAGYADKEGFRCGVCYDFTVFNILERKKLQLIEKPLIVMDGNFLSYQPDISPSEMELEIKKLISKVKKYNGNFVFLWHNSSFFYSPHWENYRKVYERCVKF